MHLANKKPKKLFDVRRWKHLLIFSRGKGNMQVACCFIKAAKKGRIDKEPLYRESALANYLKELKVIETDK